MQVHSMLDTIKGSHLLLLIPLHSQFTFYANKNNRAKESIFCFGLEKPKGSRPKKQWAMFSTT